MTATTDDSDLRQILAAAGAVYDPKFGDEPVNFGDEAGEYQALQTDSALIDFSARTRIEMTGEDRAKFLHNLCTNEIRKLPVGSGCEAFLTDARGHLLGHILVFCRSSSLLLETVPGEEAKLLAHFDRYLIREKVELHGRGAREAELLVAGPRAAETLARLATVTLPAERLSHVEAELNGMPALVARVDFTLPPGYLVFCKHDQAAAIWKSLRAAGGRPCGRQALETARIEAGFPWYGVDLTEANLPQEAARDELAISFVKGCYIGQETVARIDALGHVNKTLAGVKFAGNQAPEPGLELTAAGQIVGHTTSGCRSPRWQAPLALAYVRRGFSAPGAPLDSALAAAEVVRLPGANAAD